MRTANRDRFATARRFLERALGIPSSSFTIAEERVGGGEPKVVVTRQLGVRQLNKSLLVRREETDDVPKAAEIVQGLAAPIEHLKEPPTTLFIRKALYVWDRLLERG